MPTTVSKPAHRTYAASLLSRVDGSKTGRRPTHRWQSPAGDGMSGCEMELARDNLRTPPILKSARSLVK